MKFFEDKKVLVVDDDDDLRKEVVSILQALNFKKILDVNSVTKAKEIMLEAFNEAEPIDLILCDHHMPNNTGLQFISYIRMSLKFKNVSFITITSDSDRAVVLPYIGVGADSFIVKPVNEKDLTNKILQVLKKRAKEI